MWLHERRGDDGQAASALDVAGRAEGAWPLKGVGVQTTGARGRTKASAALYAAKAVMESR